MNESELKRLIVEISSGAKRSELRNKIPNVEIVFVEGQECLSLPLTRGKVAFIDFIDARQILPHCWCARPCVGGKNWYAERGRKQGEIWPSKCVKMHKFIMPDGPEVDHRNGNALDNRRSNLRYASHSQNQGNSALSSLSSTGYKGVTYRRGRWCARIGSFGKRVNLGHFPNPIEAAIAYNTAALKRWGKFARLNII